MKTHSFKVKTNRLFRVMLCGLPMLIARPGIFSARAAETIQISISSGPHGKVEPHGDITAPANTDFGPIVATPDLGYELEDWYFNGEHVGWTVLEIWLHNGDADVAVYVAFQRTTNLVHVTADYGGTVQPGGNGTPVSVAWGDSLTFTAQPDATYHVDTWTVNGTVRQVGGSSFTLANVTSEQSVVVTFAVDTFAVLASGVHGTVDPAGVVSVGQGNNQPFTGTADEGYSLAGWLVDGVLAQTGDYGYMLVNVQTNHTVQALFSRPVSCSQIVTNELAGATDSDSWLFNAISGDHVSISVISLSSNLTPALTVYSPLGALLAQSAAGSLGLTLTNSGDFLILVRALDSANTGQYALGVTSSACESSPQLKIERLGNETVVSWPLSSAGWTLETATNLVVASPDWIAIAPPYSSNAVDWLVIEPLAPSGRFYRLRK